MGTVRPFLREDIPEIVALRRATFPQTHRPEESDLADYLRTMFFDGPWCDESLPSKVYEDRSGRVTGFLGVFPRQMRLCDQPVRAAVFTQLMVAPEARGMAAVQLLREFINGPQDLSLSDAANEPARRLCERLGATTSLLYSMCWTRPLRPWRYAASRIGGGVAQRGIRFAARPLMRAADEAATRLDGSWFRQTAPPTQSAPLSVATMVEEWPGMAREHTLAGCFDEALLDFVVSGVAMKHEFGSLERVLVRDASGTAVGWYLYYVNAGDIGQVVHVAAAPGRYGEVLDHLFYDAWKRGAIAVRGRFMPKHCAELEAKRCVIGRDEPWTIVHSHRPEILAAVGRGDALLSRLDGEFWMTF